METFKLTDDFYKHIPYTSGVYAIRNDLNNHMYIGSTTNLRRCLRTHIGYLKNVRAICDGRKKSYKGYQWSFDKADNIGKIIRYSNCSRTRKAVGQYTVDDVLINEYQSKYDASKKCGISAANISNCLHGRSKTAGGFIWKFLDKKINYDK